MGSYTDLYAPAFNSSGKNVARVETERRQIVKDSYMSRSPRIEEIVFLFQ